MKNLVVFKRQILVRKQLGYFQPFVEYAYLFNYTPKRKEEFIKEINKNKKVLFEVMAEYDFKKIKDKDRFLSDCIKYKKLDFYSTFYENILNAFKEVENGYWD